LLSFFRNRARKEPGWLAVLVGEDAIRFVHAERAPGGRVRVTLAGERSGVQDSAAARRVVRELDFSRYRATTLLAREEYQIIVTDAPNVPREELRAAIRWRVKDLLRCHPDDAMLDVLEIPPPTGGEGRPTHQMFVIAAENSFIQARVDRCAALGIELAVIEVPETAQRNLATAAHGDGTAVALIHLLADRALITISYRGELYFARWLDIGADQLALARPERESLMDRVALEVQRSLDHFDRQYRFIGLGKLLVGPLAADDGFTDHLARAVGIEVEPYPLAEVLGGLPEPLGEPGLQGRLFHLLGAALREETKVP
jgi:MSHA biogenesis protein MshI